MSTENEFGKETGLLHQATITGRSVGADQKFWSVVAHSKPLMKKFVEIVEEYLKPSVDERELLNKWVATMMARECPYAEEESYYARSSHCNYFGFFREYHDQLSSIFRKAENNADLRPLCAEIEILFTIMYAYSSVWCVVHRPNDEWFHHPWWGLFTTFYDLTNSDDRVALGRFLSVETFLDNKAVRMVKGVMQKYDYENRPDKDKELDEAQTAEIFAVCKEAMDVQRAHLKEVIASTTWSDFKL